MVATKTHNMPRKLTFVVALQPSSPPAETCPDVEVGELAGRKVSFQEVARSIYLSRIVKLVGRAGGKPCKDIRSLLA